MKITELIPFLAENQKDIKVHCAIGRKDNLEPLHVFELGGYKEWQEHQTKKNFGRKYILSLAYCGKDEWLFVGVYESLDVKEHPTRNGYQYSTRLLNIGTEYIGRAVFSFKKEFRQSYLCFENYADDFDIIEIKRECVKPQFPGYDKVDVSWSELSQYIETDSWKTALENQKGVYLITDVKTGKRYVGKASGELMLLGRWKTYVKNGHGGNVELKELPFDYIKENFRYTILEVFKASTDDEVILNRESWWMKIFLSTEKRFGYNWSNKKALRQ